MGCKPQTGLNIMLVTEYARTTQAFAVESVEDIVRLDWKQVLSAEASGTGGKLVTSIARLDGDTDNSRSEEHTSELQSPCNLVCRLLLEKKNHRSRLTSGQV